MKLITVLALACTTTIALAQTTVNTTTQDAQKAERSIDITVSPNAQLQKSSGAIVTRLSSPSATSLGMRLPWKMDQTNKIKITVNLNNVTIQDGLKKIFEQAKQLYILDGDLPMNKTISLQMPEVPFSTALDVLTQTAGINWSREVRFANDNKVPMMTYRITKTPRGSAMAVFHPFAGTVDDGKVLFQYNSGGAPLAIADNDGIRKLISIMIPEERLTFTCPHCHGKVAAMKPPHKETTASKAVNYHWKFCPLCGKKIDLELHSSRIPIDLDRNDG